MLEGLTEPKESWSPKKCDLTLSQVGLPHPTCCQLTFCLTHILLSGIRFIALVHFYRFTTDLSSRNLSSDALSGAYLGNSYVESDSS